MAGRIPINDPALSGRMDRAMAKLLSFYPDRQVSRLDTDHKDLGERLSSLWREVGYESRTAMLEAYGFEQVILRVAAPGRKPAFDPEDLLAELQHRYEGRPKPKQIGILIHDNPDLAGNLKTLANKANEVFGRSLAKELAARGILDKGPGVADVSDEEIKAFVERLVADYSETSDKPKTLGELKKLRPDEADLIDGLRARCSDLFGTTAADYLKKRGVLLAGARYVDADAVEAVLAEIEAACAELPNSEKPTTITALALAYPEHAELLRAGQLRGLFTKETLQRRGILRLSDQAMRARRKEMAALAVRNAAVEELVALYATFGGSPLVLPGDAVTPYLHAGVIGIDTGAGCELRETTLNVINPSRSVTPRTRVTVTVGGLDESSDEISNRISTPGMDSISRLMDALDADYWIHISVGGAGVIKSIARTGACSFLPRERFEAPSTLSELVDAEVVAACDVGGVKALQVRYRFLAPLSRSTLLYALRELGAIDEQDLLGGNAWRLRQQR